MLKPELVELDVKGVTPEECINELAAKIQIIEGLDKLTIAQAVIARESQLPTAIGKGVAVPHARLPSITRPIVAVGRTNHPLTFAAPDKIPVRLVFLILTPAAAPLEQLRVLSRVATIANNDTTRRRLFRAKSPAIFLDYLRTAEALIAG